MYSQASDVEALLQLRQNNKKHEDYLNKVSSVSTEVNKVGDCSLHYLQSKGLPVNLYLKYGMRAKQAYSVNGKLINVSPSKEYLELLNVPKDNVKEYVLSKAGIKYNKDRKWTELKSLLKICWTLTDSDGEKGYCCFTEKSAQLLNVRYGIKMSVSTLRRLVDNLEAAGFVVPNTYVDRKDGEVKKNYRFDRIHPGSSYATSYLVNLKAIDNCLRDEIQAELHQEKENREMYTFVKSYKNRDKWFEEFCDTADVKSSKLFSGLYDTKTQTLLTVNGKKEILNVAKRKNFMSIYRNIVKYIREKYNIRTPEEIIKTKEWKKVVSLSKETDLSETEKINLMEYNLLKLLFNWMTNGASNIVLDKMLPEYNEGLNEYLRKDLTLNASNKGVSTRIFSEYCTTSKKDGTRKQFVESNNISFKKDITAMVPNLSRFLELGGDFECKDVYGNMCRKIENETGIKVSRQDIKQLFLRAKFTSSPKRFVSNMQIAYATKYFNNEDSEVYPFIVPFKSKSSQMYSLTKEWKDTEQGVKMINFWNSVYRIVKDTCGNDSSSLIFFWESLLELIVALKCKRSGNMCYNIYDEFYSEKEFDVTEELKLASNIVLEAYNGNTSLLEEFVNG